LPLQLACTRIGAVHSVVFAGFSAESLAGRILDSQPRVVVTATGTKRGPKDVLLKVGVAPLAPGFPTTHVTRSHAL
jgi:acetyl-CoA synthetase